MKRSIFAARKLNALNYVLTPCTAKIYVSVNISTTFREEFFSPRLFENKYLPIRESNKIYSKETEKSYNYTNNSTFQM